MFYGMEHNIDVKNRIKEIEGEVAAVSEWFHTSRKRASALNAKLGIITEITKVFREAGQFDEEQACLKYFRKLNRQWYFLNHPWQRIFHPFRWYLETLVGSFPLFAIAVLGWPLLFGVISQLISAQFDNVNPNSFIDHITHTSIMFFGLQPSGFPKGPAADILTVLIILTGFLHLGIFVSYLYTLISRR